MRLLDLFCGRWGWSKAFANRGWECVGVDLTIPPDIPKGCAFEQGDIMLLEHVWSDFDFICASSPCEQFSVHGMKHFHPNPAYPTLGIQLFEHTKRICEESGVPYVMENVAGAEKFIGQAVNHAGSFYLWGSGVPPLLPRKLSKGIKMDREWCQKLGGHGSAKRDSQTAGFATIPPELANAVADYAERIIEVRV